jgi:predicted TIM-barrel fold metal-dependent hydrolase
MAPQLFDTHAHLISDDAARYPPAPLRGHTDIPPLPKPVTDDMLLDWMDAQGVERACLVQRAHAYGYDNSYVIDCALRHPDRFVPVGVFDAQDPATPEIVERLARDQGLGGARLCAVRPWEMDTAWFNSPQAMKFWEVAARRRLPVAIIFFHHHLSYGLPALRLIAELFPELPIVIDHVGCGHGSNPEVAWGRERGQDMDAPGAPDYGLVGALTPLAAHANVSFKFTQICVERLRDAKIPLADFVRRLTDLYGPYRLVWGSDIGQSPGTYAEMTAAAHEAGARLDEDERPLFFSGNAEAIWGRGG